jgi:iron-sulfur cluster repair protein YtfE (RIC family)
MTLRVDLPLLPGARRRGTPSPLEAWRGDHLRIRAHCRTLESLVSFTASRGFDRDAQLAGHLLLRFFDIEVSMHCVDEQEVLFPMLVEAMAGSDARCIHDLIHRSTENHQGLEIMWAALRSPLEAIAGARRELLSEEQVSRFSASWRDQIQLEDTELLSLAERLLTPREIEEIHRQVRRRH